MKKLIGLLIIVTFMFSACTDNSETPEPTPKEKTKTDLLTDAKWQLDEGTIIPSITVDLGGTKLTVNNYWDLLAFAGGGTVMDCDKNNLMICKTDSSVTLDEGPTKCDPTDPQITDGGIWYFMETETKLNFSSFPMDPTGEPRILTIDLLSATNMDLTMKYDFKDPISGNTTTHDISLKYTNKK